MLKQLAAITKPNICFVRGICLFLIFLTCTVVFAENKPEPGSLSSPNIVTVDMPYNLFVALAAYQELSEAEKEGRAINKEMIPVLEDIVRELTTEKKKYEQLSISHNLKNRMEKFLIKMDKQRLGFNNELLYRQKVFKLNQLINQQNELIEEGKNNP